MRTRAAALLALSVAVAAPAHAHKGLAPWENGGPIDGDTCMQCHFDGEAVEQSKALTLDGLPEQIEAGARYALSLRLVDPGMGAAGMLVSAVDDVGAGVGAFASADAASVETNGAQARSGGKASTPKDGAIAWRMDWTAPDEIAGPIRFYLSANAANDDESPFGDTIHFREVER